jgi:hypothetical protein
MGNFFATELLSPLDGRWARRIAGSLFRGKYPGRLSHMTARGERFLRSPLPMELFPIQAIGYYFVAIRKLPIFEVGT